MKIAVLGGGGVRSMFLAKSLAGAAPTIGITQLVFMDNNQNKLRIFGGMAKEVAKRIAPNLPFVLTTDAKEAVMNADYVITTVRVGEDDARIQDERIPLSMGLLGQETTGAAGFSFAMRSVPVLVDYCKLVEQFAKPTCKVFNFTNPAGIVSQALRDAGFSFTYGICDAPSGLLHQIGGYLGAKEGELTGECYGINHLSFFSSIKRGGKEIMLELLDDDGAYQHTDLRFFPKALTKKRGCVINEYLYYYYYPERAINNILSSGKTRGERIGEINKAMLLELQGLNADTQFDQMLTIFEKHYGQREGEYMATETSIRREKKPWRFDIFSPDTGGYAGVALSCIRNQNSKTGGDMVLCVPNGGAIPMLKDSDIVEVTCTVNQAGCVPHTFQNLPEVNMELVARVKAYERMAARAILQKSKGLAVDALSLHPLVASVSLAEELVEQFVLHNQAYTKGWV